MEDILVVFYIHSQHENSKQEDESEQRTTARSLKKVKQYNETNPPQ